MNIGIYSNREGFWLIFLATLFEEAVENEEIDKYSFIEILTSSGVKALKTASELDILILDKYIPRLLRYRYEKFGVKIIYGEYHEQL